MGRVKVQGDGKRIDFYRQLFRLSVRKWSKVIILFIVEDIEEEYVDNIVLFLTW